MQAVFNKMAKKSNHVVPSSGGWSVKKSGSMRASRNFDNKASAVIYATELSRAEKTDLYIHKKNGIVHDWNSFAVNVNSKKDR